MFVDKKTLNPTLAIDSPFQTFAVGLLVEFIDRISVFNVHLAICPKNHIITVAPFRRLKYRHSINCPWNLPFKEDQTTSRSVAELGKK